MCNQLIDNYPSVTVGEYYNLTGPNNKVNHKNLAELKIKKFLETLPNN